MLNKIISLLVNLFKLFMPKKALAATVNMKNLVPIKVKIGLKNQDGSAKYPAFNDMNVIKVSGMDWSKYVDTHGLGWHYDKTSGHKESSVDSPFGMQWGVLIVPKVFADETIAKFPNECTKLTELELVDFYDNKAHKHEPDEEIDEQVLSGIKLKQDLNQVLTLEQTKALDPNDRTRGIRKNLRKKWVDYKKTVGVTIVQ